jgi:hypothetical protein
MLGVELLTVMMRMPQVLVLLAAVQQVRGSLVGSCAP